MTVPYRPGIDGLRALAVAAVVAYHLGAGGVPAGFLGVDVFFVVSGFLITSMLLTESEAHGGRVSVRRFWARRIRRLMPALVFLLVGVSLLTVLTAPELSARLRGDLPAGLGYVTNWWLVVRDQSYFESFAPPSMLRHLWSLAVEEQFYVLLPLVAAPLLRNRVRRTALAVASLAVALASTVLVAVLWSPDADPSRVWYGTDTRAAGLFVGVALALVWPIDRLRPTVARSARRLLDTVGVLALGGLAGLVITLGDREPALYRGGFLITSIASAVVVAVVAHPASNLGWVLGARPLRWLGTRSYAVYLWHWPLIQLTSPLVVRLGLTALAAEVSWRCVEQPFRQGMAQARWRASAPLTRLRLTAGASALAATLVIALAAAPSVEPPELLAGVDPTTSTTLVRLPRSTTSSSTTTTTSTTVAPPSTLPATTAPPTTAAPAPPPEPRPVLAIGDSVMLAAQRALIDAGHGRVWVDAAIGRQVHEGLDVLQRYRDNGSLASVSALVLHLGTNGPLRAHELERLLLLVEGVPRVVLVNVRVPKPWEGESNANVHAGVQRSPAFRLADWYGASSQPGVLASDGVHPSVPGARVYAFTVLDRVNEPAPPPPTTTTTTTAPPTTTTSAPTTTTAPPATTSTPPPDPDGDAAAAPPR